MQRSLGPKPFPYMYIHAHNIMHRKGGGVSWPSTGSLNGSVD